MRGLGLLVFLIVAAIQIISAIAAKRKKEEERRIAMEAAERRRIMMETGITDATQARPSPAAATHASRDDLEARRRAQLEQLRQRREGKRQGTPTPLAPPVARRGVPTPTLAPSHPSASSFPMMSGSDQARSRAMETERRNREQERLRRQEQARVVEERAEATQRADRAAYETQFHSAIGDHDVSHTGQTQTIGVPSTAGARPVASAHGEAASLRARFRDPANLRELIVLQELLQRPVGLR